MSSALVRVFYISMECVLLPEVHSGGNTDYQQDVQQQIFPDAPLEQVMRNEETVVTVEHNEERERNDTAMTQIFHQRNGESAACHHHERKCKHNSPADDVNQGFNDA